MSSMNLEKSMKWGKLPPSISLATVMEAVNELDSYSRSPKVPFSEKVIYKESLDIVLNAIRKEMRCQAPRIR